MRGVCKCRWLMPMLLMHLAAVAEEVPESWSYKLTPSHYSNSRQPSAWDVNLRGNLGQQTLWVAQYQQGADAENAKFRQSRVGYENAMQMPWGILVPSLQLATGRFAGGSLNAQIGGPDAYTLLGFGRTNLRPYYNLNFDPNDAITLGLARRLPDHSMLTVYGIWDDRLGTSQKVAHLLWRKSLDEQQRLTVDLALKKGRPEAGQPLLHGHMVSVGLDHGPLFFKLTLDRKVNFSDTDQVRTQAGVRF